MDSAIFFARGEESHRLASLVAVYRGVMLYGDSGAGKSSLINAGLLPRVVDRGLDPERIRVQPRRGQELVIERIATSDGGETVLPSLFAEDDAAPQAVVSLEAFEERLADLPESAKPLLVFDQFEEILTLFDEVEAGELRDELVGLLVRMLRGSTPVKIVFSFREDYLGRLAELLAECPELIDQSLRLAPPSAESLWTIIRGPFEDGSVQFSHELTPRLAERLRVALEERFGAGDVSLSEVQTVCLRLWESDDPDALLTSKGVQGLLEDYLGEALEALPPATRAAAIALLSEMVTSAGTRNVVSAEDLVHRVHGEEGISRKRLDTALVQLERESRLVRRERRRDLYLYELTSEFLVPWISKRRAELERQQHRRKERRRLLAACGLAIVAVAVAVLALLVLMKEHKLRQETAQATYLGLTSDAQSELGRRPDVAMLLLIAAHHTRAEFAAQNSLLAALQAARRAGTVGILHGHTDPVERVAFSHDPNVLASAGADKTIRFWNVTNHRMLGAPLHAEDAPVFSMAFSNDGKMLASGSFDDIRLWNAGRRSELYRLQPRGTGAVTSLAFSPGDKQLAYGALGGQVVLWDIAQRQGHPLRAAVGAVRSVAFTRDGRILAASGNHGFQLFDANTGRALDKAVDYAPRATLYSVAFSPDGKLLATGTNKQVILWNVQTRGQIAGLSGPTGVVNGVAFNPGGDTLAAGSADGDVWLWDTRTHEALRSSPLVGHAAGVTDVTFSSNGRILASASADRTIRLWSVAAKESQLARFAIHHNIVRGFAFSPNGRELASADINGVILVSDLASRRTVARMRDATGVYSLAFAPGGLLVSGDAHGKIVFWNVRTGMPQGQSLSADDGTVFTLALSPNGKILASAGADKVVHLWDVATRKLVRVLRGHRAAIYSLAFSPDGRLLASGSDDRTVLFWNVATGLQHGKPLIHTNGVFSVAFSSGGGLLATGSADDTVRLWNVHTRTELEGSPLTGHSSLVRSVAFAPRGATLASGSSDRTIRLWDVSTQSQLGAPLTGSLGSVEAVAFGRSGMLASSGSEGAVRTWGVVSSPSYGELQTEVCRFVGSGLSDAEWTQYAPHIHHTNVCQ